MSAAGFVLGGTELEAFVRYCASFYGDGPESLDGPSMPGGPFTRAEIRAAVILVANVYADSFAADSVDRERVRDVVLAVRAMRGCGWLCGYWDCACDLVHDCAVRP